MKMTKTSNASYSFQNKEQNTLQSFGSNNRNRVNTTSCHAVSKKHFKYLVDFQVHQDLNPGSYETNPIYSTALWG